MTETSRRLQEELTVANEAHFDATERKVFEAYNIQKEYQENVQTELIALRDQVMGSSDSGVKVHPNDLGELINLKKNGSILEGLCDLMLNRIVEATKNQNAYKFADRNET